MFLDNNKKFYSSNEVCELLGVSKMTLRRWAKSGKLTRFKLGGGRYNKTIYSRETVENLLNMSEGL